MHTEISELSHFYQSPLGKQTGKILSAKIADICKSVKGQKILGLGYTLPFLAQFLNTATHTLSFMPVFLGVSKWPSPQKNLCVLVDERNLPLDDQSIDVVILVHALDCTESLHKMLSEVWRVLAGNGKLILVVPNRRGLWARSDQTPFGDGRSFSHPQLRKMLSNAHFMVDRLHRSLFLPPFESQILGKFASLFEFFGPKFFPGLTGVYVVEATKQIYSLNPAALFHSKNLAGAFIQPATS